MQFIKNTNNQIKAGILVIGILVAYAGFMIKLPFVFRHIDKELHAAFYFLAALVMCWLFDVKKFKINLLIGASLFVFGVFVELSQHYSNYILHRRIHGRFDIVDIKYNLYGIVAFVFVLALLKILRPNRFQKPVRSVRY